MTEKIYLENPYLRELSAKVVKKDYIDGAFHLTLNRTLFFPHLAGGQPKDEGTINGAKVIDVYEENENIIHVLEDDVFSNNVNLVIDWDTRFTHMQQHTGQHILSTIFDKLYRAKTVGFHLGSEFVYIDVTLPELDTSTIEKVENYANKIIFSNFDIKTYLVDKHEASTLPLRKQPIVDTNIRIVEIDKIEYSPCCGTHVRATGEVGIIKIRKWEKYKGNVRIEFVCGGRALSDYRWKNNQINEISNLLSVKDNTSYNAVQRIYDENKDLLNNIRNLKKELLQYKASELIEKAVIHNDIKVVNAIFEKEDFKEIKNMATQIISISKAIVIFGVIEKDKCQIVLGRSDDIDINMRDIFKHTIDIIDGRGGGSPQLVQGGGTKIDKLEECIDSSLKMIKNKLYL